MLGRFSYILIGTFVLSVKFLLLGKRLSCIFTFRYLTTFEKKKNKNVDNFFNIMNYFITCNKSGLT